MRPGRANMDALEIPRIMAQRVELVARSLHDRGDIR
jgi:hypothetical protein